MTKDLFAQGWLTEHLNKLVKEIKELPVEQQPRLNGFRAPIMDGPHWLKELGK